MENNTNKRIIFGIGLAILIIIAIAYRYSGRLASIPREAPNLLAAINTQLGADVVLKGTIVESQNSLPSDGDASVSIRISDTEVAKVVYNQGWNACKNPWNDSKPWSTGERIEVFGRVIQTKPLIVSTCLDSKYYIRR